MTGGAVGSVVESRDPEFRVGDAVEGMLGWQEYAVAQGRELRKIDPDVAPISTALGVLGMPGLTAYFGLLDICDPQPGETVVVSGAAGAVGMIVGQIAKIRGCRVVGVAGSDAKISWLLDELGFDAAFNYKVGGGLPRQARGSSAPPASTSTSTTSAARSPMRSCDCINARARICRLRADLAVQPGGARAGAALARAS